MGEIEEMLINLNQNLRDITGPDVEFSNFIDKFAIIANKHLPIKKLSKKEQKTKLNPWITKGILKSIQKNK